MVPGIKEITTLALSGKTGAPFTASYVEYGGRTNVTATLPWNYWGMNLSEFEFRKGNPGDVFWFEMHHAGYGPLEQKGSLSAGGRGVRWRMNFMQVNTEFIGP